MKKGVLSILIATIGFFFTYKYHTLMYEIQNSLITGKEINFLFINDLASFRKLFKIVVIIVSLLSFYLGIMSVLKKSKIGIVGIILASILFISVFINFWKYFI
ncbi:hypothetical protein D1815_08730 [Aquimarina sp. AD1]|uniref:hypothetical protein n=1 Tax=Aquimarina sp. (strain AD1) TaxID=1714848 RepID=UPI000E4BE2F8|nr:hypothetical protein [Aquimarina sp. AD1]AXT55829.1 hypothetical protein D1815_08730 [Aquimarina sp. AD1]RKN29745.1 hypothetical protein D7035_06845 [Aquimarina sp. AD1]